MTMTFFEAAAASSSGLTLMIEGPVEAAGSFSESGASRLRGCRLVGRRARQPPASSPPLRRGCGTACRAARSHRRWRPGKARRGRFRAIGRRTGAAPAAGPCPSGSVRVDARSRSVAAIGSRCEPASFGSGGPDFENCRNRGGSGSDSKRERQSVPVSGPPQAYWLRTALSGFGGKDGSVFWPRNSS